MILLLIHKSWPLQIKSKRTGLFFFLDTVWERFQKSGWAFASDLDDAYIYVPVLKIVILKNKWCKGFHSPPPMSRAMPSWSPNTVHLPKKTLPHFLLLNAVLHGMHYPLGLLGSTVLADPIQAPSHSQTSQWETDWDENQGLMLCNHCSATAKTVMCYQHCFSHKFKMQPHMGCYND